MHIETGKSIEEIVALRSLTFGTICDHIEKLYEAGTVSGDDILDLLPERLMDVLPKIREAFQKTGGVKLAPVFAALKGKYSYDELKLARLAIISEK